ncbi:MAG: glucose 1-dehydrogenase [Chthonomonadales bacterium]
MSSFDISGRVVLVTGGTNGLGRAIAEGMAKAGAIVHICSRDTNKVIEAARALKAIHTQNDGYTADVTDAESFNEVVDEIVEKEGSLDILVNAAGITSRAPALEMTIDDWNRIINVNLTGTFISNQAAARVMKDQPKGGSIVNIASLASFMGWSLVAAYGASKAGVVQLTQTLAVEWAEYNIRVNAIAPGVFPTDLNRALIDGTPRGKWFKDHTPMGRFGNSDELVGAAIFLASDAASYVTGVTLPVDGGYLANGIQPNPPG